MTIVTTSETLVVQQGKNKRVSAMDLETSIIFLFNKQRSALPQSDISCKLIKAIVRDFQDCKIVKSRKSRNTLYRLNRLA